MFRPTITDKSPRLFKNDLLELLSRTHPAVVVIIYLPIVAALLWHGAALPGVGVALAGALAVAGVITWTITEYWLHRTIMHWIPEKPWGSRMHFWVHGVHHDWPDDPYRLVMPPTVSMALFLVFLGLFNLAFGKFCWAFHGGFTLGYIIYDLTHYYVHHSKPQYAWVRALQKHHLFHHFNPKYDERKFSITVPFWDRMFGTDTPVESGKPQDRDSGRAA
ncbi:MAG: sterol desaturase family protein [Candidatus Zixiibacteriota bacterium]